MDIRGAATGLVLTLVLAGCGESEAPADRSPAAPELAVTRAQRIAAPREQTFDGVLEAVAQSTISAQAYGRVVDLPVDVNDAVRKGDLIARLRDAEPRAQLLAARARLREAEAEYRRTREVFDKKLIAQAQMDRASAARDTAQAALDAAAEQQEHVLIRAPYAGIVTARPVQLGELATPGTPIVSLLSLDRLRAVVDVPQQLVEAVRSSSGARVILPDGAALDAGQVRVFPYADERAHTFRVRVELPETGAHRAYPGELVKVLFRIESAPRLTVAADALVQRGEITGLYVVDAQQHLEFRAVRSGAALPDGRVEILAGLETGEQVVDDPVAAAARLRAPAGAAR
jgi:RND family efflux transporter MFP subunit